MTWRWAYEGDRGGSGEFASQADAEVWLSDNWRDLLESGIPAVTLTEDGRAIYGPMSLEPD